MNQAVANIIKTHIEGLDFVDKIAGLTAVTYFDVKNKDGELVQKAVPIACCVTADDCKEGAYNDMMPDSKYKTVIYFEDRGVKFLRKESHWKYYESNLRLVCWINVAKILEDDCNTGTACTLAAHLIAEIVRVLPEFPQHHAPFNYVYSEVVSQEIRSNSIFAAYTYDEKHSQYLMYPYDYFALDIQTLFAICIDGTGVYDSDCGATVVDLDTPVATEATDVTTSGFTANWLAVNGATGYIIEVASDSDFTTLVADENVGNLLSVSITGLPSDTYYYRIKAYSDTDTSDNSNVITVIGEAVDGDGNSYDSVVIGDLEWLTENLKTTKYIDGTDIPNLTVSQYNDYFLPSKDELNAMYINLKLFGVGNFLDGTYWSSYQRPTAGGLCYNIDFSDGNGLESTPSAIMHVRACRSFISTDSYALRDTGPAGGLIFSITDNGDTTYTYLETSTNDLSDSFWWNLLISISDANGTAIGTGQANTTAIIGQVGHTDSAAKLCSDLDLGGGWVNDTTGAYCFYNNDIANKAIYGGLYNWYAVNNAHGLAPTGWRVATNADYIALSAELGGDAVAGAKLKEMGLTHWNTPNDWIGTTNESGFTALGSGRRFSDGSFSWLKIYCSLWTNTQFDATRAYNHLLVFNANNLNSNNALFANGYSVRCVRDI